MAHGETDLSAIAELAEQQALLDFALSQSAMVFLLAEIDGPIRFVSPNVEKLTGHLREAFLSEPGFLVGLIHAEDRARFDEALHRLSTDGQSTLELRLANADGADRWFRLQLQSRSGTGGGGRYAASLLDITAQRAAEADREHLTALLADSEKQFSAVLEGNPSPLRITDFETWTVLWESPATAALFGYAWPGEKGRSTKGTYADEAEAQRAIDLLSERGKIDGLEVTMRRADGSTLPVSLSTRMVDYRDRKVCITSLVDLTETKARESELRQARESLEDAIGALSEGLVLYDQEDRLVICNDQYRAFNHQSPELFVPGVRWVDAARSRAEQGQFPNAVGRLEEWLEERVAERGGVINEEFQMSDGRWYEHSHRRTRQGGLVTTWRDVTERKAMEEALRTSEEKVRLVLENCPLPVRMWNPASGEVIYDSPACQAILGKDLSIEAPEHKYAVHVDVSDRERYLTRLRTENEVDNMEMRLRRADGSAFWAGVSARLTEYRGEEVVVSVIRDLSDQKQREAELRQIRGTLEDAIESLSEGLVLYNAHDRMVLCNSQYRAFHGEHADILKPGKTWPEISRERGERGLFKNAVGKLDEWYNEQMEQRGIAQHEEFPWHDGRWFEYSHRPTRQGGFVSTWRDVTERKAMVQALSQSEELLRNVLSVCPVPITMYGIETGEVVYENPAAEKLFGPAERDTPQHRPSRWTDHGVRRRLVDKLQNDGVLDGTEAEFRRADGSPFRGAMFARVIDYQDTLVAVSSVFDLTERQEAEAEMAHQRELLHQSEKLSALGELLAGVAHELNNPLSVLVGQALLLREISGDSEISKRASKIGDAANRCARIVKTFLALARQQPSEAKAVNINRVIHAALEVTAYSLRASGIEVTTNLAEDVPSITADEDQIHQVITNLIINADQALQDVSGHRSLTITTETDRSTALVVTIRDNGPGIPPELRRRIFEPLFTTKEVGSGTGIGLALCHRVIEAHGGSISIDSPANGGAIFKLRLPIEGPEESDSPEAGGDPAPHVGYRILVVDDEPEVAELLGEILSGDGHDVDLALTGDDALSQIAAVKYDYLLSDIRMPGLDGPHLYQAVIDRYPDLAERVAFITGDTMSSKVHAFLSEVGCLYIEKPVTPQDVRDLIRSLSDPDAR